MTVRCQEHGVGPVAVRQIKPLHSVPFSAQSQSTAIIRDGKAFNSHQAGCARDHPQGRIARPDVVVVCKGAVLVPGPNQLAHDAGFELSLELGLEGPCSRAKRPADIHRPDP